jgi:hypothetical protein
MTSQLSEAQRQQQVELLKQEFERGSLKRREFLTRWLALGFSAPLAYAVLGELGEEVQAQTTHHKVDAKQSKAVLEKMHKIATHPRVLASLDEIGKAPEKDRAKLAAKLITQLHGDKKFQKEVGVGPEFRISSRVFEDPGKVKLLASHPALGRGGGLNETNICASIGYQAGLIPICVSIGASPASEVRA